MPLSNRIKMAKHRGKYTKQVAKGLGLNIGKSIWPYVRELTTPLTFIEQISAKDRETLGSAWDNAGWIQKGKIMLNIITSRTSGFALFKDEYRAQFTLNPNGVINKWTTTGFAFWVYSKVPIKFLPLRSKFGAIGKRMMTGGGVGGLFDAKDGISQTSNAGTRHILPPDANRGQAIIQYNRAVDRYNKNDTVDGGFDA